MRAIPIEGAFQTLLGVVGWTIAKQALGFGYAGEGVLDISGDHRSYHRHTLASVPSHREQRCEAAAPAPPYLW